MINEAKNKIIDQMSRITNEHARLTRARDDILRKHKEVQACEDLLTAERTYTFEETERLAELLEPGPLPQPDFERDFHIRAALMKCAVEYRQLDRRILAELEMTRSATSEVLDELRALDKEWDEPYGNLMRDVMERSTSVIVDLINRLQEPMGQSTVQTARTVSAVLDSATTSFFADSTSVA
ncbi:unnamed protein product [Peniophora sp. CBMAI 1063]|nr:unnamed protein product [Peniophora sp. CBMAI 1063]